MDGRLAAAHESEAGRAHALVRSKLESHIRDVLQQSRQVAGEETTQPCG